MTCSACEWRLTSGGVRSLIINTVDRRLTDQQCAYVVVWFRVQRIDFVFTENRIEREKKSRITPCPVLSPLRVPFPSHVSLKKNPICRYARKKERPFSLCVSVWKNVHLRVHLSTRKREQKRRWSRFSEQMVFTRKRQRRMRPQSERPLQGRSGEGSPPYYPADLGHPCLSKWPARRMLWQQRRYRRRQLQSS
jgi:hypothetical protein